MKMKWFVVFCCLIILILGGLLAAGRHFYQQDALEYQRLLAEAESLISDQGVTIKKQALQVGMNAELVKKNARLIRFNDGIERQLEGLLSQRPEWGVAIEKTITEYIEVPVRTRWFESVEELETWRAAHNDVLYIGGREAKCWEYAERRMEQAEADGFRLPVAPVWAGRMFGENVSSHGDGHVGNWNWIGKKIYYVEAFPTDDPIDKIHGTWLDMD